MDRRPEGKAKRLNSIVLNAAVADIVTTEVPGAGWIPTYQRIELEVLIPLTTESWSTLRVMTALRDLAPDVGSGGRAPGPGADGSDARPLRRPEGLARTNTGSGSSRPTRRSTR